MTKNEERKQKEIVAALKWVFEFIYSTKILLAGNVISFRNFDFLVREQLIESELVKVSLSPNTKKQNIYVYGLTEKGRNYLKNHDKNLRARYLRNNYERTFVHDLIAQAYIKHKKFTLDVATSSIDLIATHAKFKATKYHRWQRWRYDAIAHDENVLYAIEVERHIKRGFDVETNKKQSAQQQARTNAAKQAQERAKNIFLSKIYDFINGKSDKLHCVKIVCTEPRIAEYWRERICKEFEYWTYESGAQNPSTRGNMKKIENHELIEIVEFDRAQLETIALPENKRRAVSTPVGVVAPTKSPRPTNELAERVRRVVNDDDKLKRLLTRERDKVAKSTIERVYSDIEAKLHEEHANEVKTLQNAVMRANELRDEALSSYEQDRLLIHRLLDEIWLLEYELSMINSNIITNIIKDDERYAKVKRSIENSVLSSRKIHNFKDKNETMSAAKKRAEKLMKKD